MNDPSPTPLAELVQRLRTEAGLSMYELAKRSGINRSTLMRIEDGTTTQPDSGTLNTLARALNVEPEVFYDAVWQDTDAPLPSLGLYFRSKYRLSPRQIAEIEDSIQHITDKPGKGNRKERRSS